MLTHAMKLYAQARANGHNRRDSAVAAGYSAKTASASASRLERDPRVQEHMRRLGFEPTVKAKPLPPTKPKPTKEEISAAKKANAEKITKELAEQAKHSEPDGFESPLDYFKHLTNHPNEDPKLRLEAAKAWASFTVAKPGSEGKKAGQKKKAGQVASSGRFGAQAAPSNVRSIN